MSIARRLRISSGAILEEYAIALLIAMPILTNAAVAGSPTYTLSEKDSGPELLAENPGNGNGGGNGKGGGNGGAGSDAGSGGGGTADAGDQDGGTSTSSGSSDVPQQSTDAQEVPVADLEQAESYPDGTFPDSYFIDKPLKKLQLQRYLVTDEYGRVVSSTTLGDNIEIALSFKNLQQKEQLYMLITQVTDQNSVTRDIGWSIDAVESGGYVDMVKLWKTDSLGICTIKVMIWDWAEESPTPLSEMNAMAIVVYSSNP